MGVSDFLLDKHSTVWQDFSSNVGFTIAGTARTSNDKTDKENVAIFRKSHIRGVD